MTATTAKLGTVMVIDDDSIDQMLYKRVIERSGVADTVLGYQYAAEALAHLHDPSKPKVDVIFLDINMPGMNGFEFLERACSELGDDFASMVVIMLTTSIDPRDHERASRYQVIRKYLGKPLTTEQFLEIVADYEATQRRD